MLVGVWRGTEGEQHTDIVISTVSWTLGSLQRKHDALLILLSY